MALVSEDRLFVGNPRGVGVYNSNRQTFGGIGGAGVTGLTEIPDEYVTESELNVAIQGKTGTFRGIDMTDNQISIAHNLNYEPVGCDLYDSAGVLVNPSNYELDTQNSIWYIVLTIVFPIDDADQFKYRIL